jgi:hypothetical protein
MTPSALSLLLVGTLALPSSGQDTPPKQPNLLGPGDHTRNLMMGGQKRTYLVHVS